ncbi:NADAR family protein [Candidatus Pacebacteria bacterium]|nr:NADAR family protein [Candidatus Paceibacterota bacterium]
MSAENKTSDPNYVTAEAVYFYTPRFYAFDNFSAFQIFIWDRTFPTSEHAYQWRKFSEASLEIAAQIFTATNPHEVKKLSDQYADCRDPSWDEIKREIMEEILLAKVTQHEKLVKLLRETDDRAIVENSPTDYYWGIGEDGSGQNHLGKIWMKLRAELN